MHTQPMTSVSLCSQTSLKLMGGPAVLEEDTHHSGSTSMAATCSASLPYCSASSFVLPISQYSDAHYQFDLESFHGGRQICTQEMMHSNCSPSCKTSLCTKAAQQHTFTSVMTLEKLHFIVMRKQIPHV